MLKIRRFGYFWLNTWVVANVIQLATQEFCKKFLNLKNDPCGRQFDQMTQACTFGCGKYRRGQFAAFDLQRDGDEVDRCGAREHSRVDERLCQLVDARGTDTMVGQIAGIQACV